MQGQVNTHASCCGFQQDLPSGPLARSQPTGQAGGAEGDTDNTAQHRGPSLLTTQHTPWLLRDPGTQLVPRRSPVLGSTPPDFAIGKKRMFQEDTEILRPQGWCVCPRVADVIWRGQHTPSGSPVPPSMLSLPALLPDSGIMGVLPSML